MTETIYDQIKIAIGEILREADATSKLIIGAYNHSAVHATNVKALSLSKFKAEQLESCLKFIGLNTREEENSQHGNTSWQNYYENRSHLFFRVSRSWRRVPSQ